MKHLIRYKIYENNNSDFYRESSMSEWINDYGNHFMGFDSNEISKIKESLNNKGLYPNRLNEIRYNGIFQKYMNPSSEEEYFYIKNRDNGIYLSIDNKFQVEEFQIYKGRDEYYFIQRKIDGGIYYFICDQYDGLLKFFKDNNI